MGTRSGPLPVQLICLRRATLYNPTTHPRLITIYADARSFQVCQQLMLEVLHFPRTFSINFLAIG